MKRKIISALLSLCLLAAVFGGCGAKTGSGSAAQQAASSVTSQSEAGKAQSSQNSKKEISSQAQSSVRQSAVQKTYTMADIRKLKNTEHFAKKTLEHIFDGTINAKGNATGYHYTQVTDSKGTVISGTASDKDAHGVFTAKVKVSGVKKNGFSSFYPEEWTPQQVVDAINAAYDDALNNPSNPRGSLWVGYSGDLEIDMYLDNNKRITTAFPIYEGD